MHKIEWKWFLMNLFSPENILFILGVFIIIIFMVITIFDFIKLLKYDAEVRKKISKIYQFENETDKSEEENESKNEKNESKNEEDVEKKDDDKIFIESVGKEKAILISNFIKMKKFMMED